MLRFVRPATTTPREQTVSESTSAADLYASFKQKTCPLTPMLRTTCQKCGVATNSDPQRNLGIMAWCDLCRWLLREPESPHARYSRVEPSSATLAALGLVPSFVQRSVDEWIPLHSRVEQWPELTPADPIRESFDRIFKRIA